MKAALLRGNKGCPNLVSYSVYDTKPVHFLSMVCQQLKWIVKEKPVFNVETGRVESLRFLIMNKINDYNNNMGHVDISYQLQNEYRFNRWIRNCKWWWWSLLFWALGVMLVNAYVIYSIVNITEGTPKKDPLSHHNFRKSIAMNWINTDRDYSQDQGSTTSSKRKRKTASSV